MPRPIISRVKPVFWVLVLALVIRLIPLNQSLWLDEAINVTAARDRGVVDLLTNYSLGDFHPPFYHLVLHYWIQLTDAGEFSTRMPSVIFGLLTIYFLYQVSLLLFPKNELINLKGARLKPALIPPLLLATSGLHVYYSGEARMYSLAAFLTTLSVYLLLYLRHPKRKFFSASSKTYSSLHLLQYDKRTSAFFIASLSLLLLTDYVPWLLWPLFLFFLPAHAVVSLLITAPWWPYFLRQLSIGLGVATDYPLWGQVVGAFSLKNLALIPIKFTIGRVSLDNNLLYALALAIPLLTIIFCFYKAYQNWRRHKTQSKAVVFTWFFLPLIAGALLSLKISLLSYFRFLFVLPAFYLFVTWGLTRLKPSRKSLALIILLATNLISTGAYLFMPKFHREDWRTFSQYIDHVNDPTAVVVFPSLAQAAPYYYYQQTIPATDKIDFNELPDTVFLVRYVQEIFDPQDLNRLQLEDLGYSLVEQNNFNGVVVWTYLKSVKLYANN